MSYNFINSNILWSSTTGITTSFTSSNIGTISYNSMSSKVVITYKIGDKVNTPMGDGVISFIDKDGLFCIELNINPGALYEFDKDEIKHLKEAK